MNIATNTNLKDLKLNWRKHVYTMAGIAIVGLLAFIIFRSFAFLGGRLVAVFQFESPQTWRVEFDVTNFEKIKYRLD